MNTKQILSIISNLPFNQQVENVDQILQTLHQPDPDVEQVWMDEVERRAMEVDSGGSQNDSW
ncbi:addiction module protein [Rhodohalobacter sp. SW132]|uniref:addiction module protein n=1 Tax=Rhodohalobacter sp. SW132 TaxID=2293433 RepID=UPI000E2334A4|nr:addiction module protein [Rhodohalobacter sp. SW132]REL37890.1 addiction module protein [Rhodohalobacter sp. SW132]